MKHLSTAFLMLLVLGITFSANGTIDVLDSQDADDITDDDEIYHSGQKIKIIATDSENQTGLTGTVLITSETTAYSSEKQDLIDEENGSYHFIWDTAGLGEAEDYVVEIGLKDFLERETLDDSLTIQIDNIPLPQGEFVINDGQESTESRSVNLTISAENAEEMYLDGDIVDDKETFEWIDFASDKQVNLIQGDGEKIVSVKFRNSAQIESKLVSESIILDLEPPVITLMESYDDTTPEDNDDYYHAGQSIRFNIVASESATSTKNEPGLLGTIQIRSEEVSYDSGQQKLTDEGDGSYSYLWDTTGLKEADDYLVEAMIKDQADYVTTADLTISIDNTSPSDYELRIIDESEITETNTRSITLEISAEDAKEMLIEGDVVNDTNTFEWIPFTPAPDFSQVLVVNLTTGEGEKVVNAKFRDEADNDSESIEAKIVLNAYPPAIQSVDSAAQDDLTDSDEIYHAGQQILISIQAADLENGLESMLQIRSEEGGYDSDLQVANDNDEGNYSYLWDTSGLTDATDYVVEVTLQDSLGQKAVDDSLTITIDNEPPSDCKVQIPDQDTHAHSGSSDPEPLNTRSITLEIEGLDAVEMFIEGDIINDTNTFEWIPFAEEIVVNIAGDDGKKLIKAKFRDAARNESEDVEVVDKSEGQMASGIDEQNIYAIFDYNPEQALQFTKVSDEEPASSDAAEEPASSDAAEEIASSDAAEEIASSDAAEEIASSDATAVNKYIIPSGRFILNRGKRSVTFVVADKAGNYTEETAEYTVMGTSASPILELMNYPNPFEAGGSTTIRYILTEAVKSAEMYIYDAGGNLVWLKEMENDELEAGAHKNLWTGKDLFGTSLSRGVYFCEFRVVAKDSDKTTKKLNKIAVW